MQRSSARHADIAVRFQIFRRISAHINVKLFCEACRCYSALLDVRFIATHVKVEFFCEACRFYSVLSDLRYISAHTPVLGEAPLRGMQMLR